MPNDRPVVEEIDDLPIPIQEDEREEFSLLKIATDRDLTAALATMENSLAYIDKVRDAVLKRSKPKDWTDQSGHPYFGESGCNRFMGPFQIFEKDVEAWTIDDKGIKRNFDEKNVFEGNILFIMFRGILGSKLLGIEASFEGGSKLDDGFKLKDDVLFYSLKAKANWRGRGFRKILGMENMTWEDLASVGIKREEVKKVERQTTAKADSKEAAEVWNLLLELNEGDPKKAEDYLFKMTDQPPKFPGKRRPAHCSEKALAWIGAKIRSEHHAKFPDKKLTGATENGGAHPLDDAFRSSVENLQKLVAKDDYLAVLKEFGVGDAVEVSASKRNAFLTTLASKRKGGAQ